MKRIRGRREDIVTRRREERGVKKSRERGGGAEEEDRKWIKKNIESNRCTADAADSTHTLVSALHKDTKTHFYRKALKHHRVTVD